MHKVHSFACVLLTLYPPPAPALVSPGAVNASALKAPLKRAGGAGKALSTKVANIKKYYIVSLSLHFQGYN